MERREENFNGEKRVADGPDELMLASYLLLSPGYPQGVRRALGLDEWRKKIRLKGIYCPLSIQR